MSTKLDLAQLLHSLYQRQMALRPDDVYLQAHAQPKVVQTQAAVFDFYARYLPARGRILDWGCRHAPDACMLRARFGGELHIAGCDFAEPEAYSVFHDYAGLQFQTLEHTSRLPYDDDVFDAIIASGTLEHVAQDYESLKELYRVLRNDGTLVITYLPNRLSFEEWHKRRLRREGFHRRLYGLAEAVQLLKHAGFYPHLAGYQTRLDLLPAKSFRHRMLRAVRRLLPLHRFSSTLSIIAVKVHSM